MTYQEAARLQGYDTRCLKFDPDPGNNHFLVGNTMSVPVLERLWVATQRAQGFTVDDPWVDSIRQAQLVEAAMQDTLTPTNFHSLRTAANIAQQRKKEDDPLQVAVFSICSPKRP